jgi:hypothetical protein
MMIDKAYKPTEIDLSESGIRLFVNDQEISARRGVGSLLSSGNVTAAIPTASALGSPPPAAPEARATSPPIGGRSSPYDSPRPPGGRLMACSPSGVAAGRVPPQRASTGFLGLAQKMPRHGRSGARLEVGLDMCAGNEAAHSLTLFPAPAARQSILRAGSVSV